MSQAQYEIYLSDHTGRAFRRNITGMVMTVEATRVVNGIGQCSVTLLPDLLDESYFHRDARIAIYRSLPGRVPSLLFNTIYLLRRKKTSYEQATKKRVLLAVCLNHLISRRKIAYKAASSQARKVTTAIDDMIKAFVAENIGASATDATRDLSAYITIGANLTAAPTTTKAAAYRPLLQVCQELAQASAEAGTYLAFDLSALTEDTFLFETYTGQRGVDRRQGSANQFVLSLQRGNFDNIELDRDWSGEVTRAYAGAQGIDSDRNVQSSTNSTRASASAFNLIEDFSDVRHLGQNDTAAATDEAEARVREGRPKTRVRGDLIETDGSIYDVHYAWGDYVTADIDSEQFDCRLDVARVRLGRESPDQPFEERFDIAATLEDDDDV